MTLQSIPATTWEQFGLVILIMAFIIILADRAIKFITIVKKIIDDTNKSFQNFLVEQRKSDHSEQLDREKAFAERNARLAETIEKVVGIVEKLVISQETHNTEMREAVARMDAKVMPRNK